MIDLTTTSDPSGYARAVALGTVAGLRSMTPFALLSAAAQRRGSPAGFAAGLPAPLGLLRSRAALAVTACAAIGEMAGDKVPMVPSRLNPGPLGGRLVIGALAGAAACVDARLNPLVGGLLGAAGAAGGAVGGYNARKVLADTTDWPNPVWGVIEDAVALTIGFTALRAYFS